jgi:hypothetical protein
MRFQNLSVAHLVFSLVFSCTALTFLPLTSLYSQSANSHPPIPHPCQNDPAYHELDFWIGSWDVYDNHDHTLNGSDVVEKIVGGCAIVENWKEADGSGEGKSLFYYQEARKQWKQVWVTDAGPIKEKQLIEETKDGGVRFQGEILHRDGKSHLDRTTLTPLPGKRVHQVIEISRDSGKTWEIVFDAEYRRHASQ